MNVRQHIPNFVTGVEPEEGQASTLAELRAMRFVAAWEIVPGFVRWEVSKIYLMAILKDSFYVAAYLEEPHLYGLPEWKGKPNENRGRAG